MIGPAPGPQIQFRTVGYNFTYGPVWSGRPGRLREVVGTVLITAETMAAPFAKGTPFRVPVMIGETMADVQSYSGGLWSPRFTST